MWYCVIIGYTLQITKKIFLQVSFDLGNRGKIFKDKGKSVFHDMKNTVETRCACKTLLPLQLTFFEKM